MTQSKRKEALEWWRGLTKHQQSARAHYFKMKQNDFKKTWSIQMIMLSDGCIEQMYESQKQTA